MGSMFTRYKSPALVNLDWTTTFTPSLRKDIDLGLALGRESGRADAGHRRYPRSAANAFRRGDAQVESG